MKRRMLLIGTLLLSAMFVGACSSAPKLEIKIGDKSSTLNIKSAGVAYGNVISTSPGKPNVQTFAHTVYIANYELDTSNAGTMRKALTASDQMRVGFELTGEEGTKDDSPLKVGTYKAKADKINSVRWVSIATFADGKETTTDFDTMGLTPKADGDVKITSVTADSISGEVNLTEGDKSIKGTFTAKLPQKK